MLALRERRCAISCGSMGLFESQRLILRRQGLRGASFL